MRTIKRTTIQKLPNGRRFALASMDSEAGIVEMHTDANAGLQSSKVCRYRILFSDSESSITFRATCTRVGPFVYAVKAVPGSLRVFVPQAVSA